MITKKFIQDHLISYASTFGVVFLYLIGTSLQGYIANPQALTGAVITSIIVAALRGAVKMLIQSLTTKSIDPAPLVVNQPSTVYVSPSGLTAIPHDTTQPTQQG